MGAKARTPAGDRLDVLVTLIEDYERHHFPMDLPDAVEAIKLRMEQQGLTPKDLEPLIGRSNRVYEVLNRRRGLTLAMIQRLHAGLGVPAESLLRQTVAPAARVLLRQALHLLSLQGSGRCTTYGSPNRMGCAWCRPPAAGWQLLRALPKGELSRLWGTQVKAHLDGVPRGLRRACPT